MSPFRDYPYGFPGAARCCPFGGCAVCYSEPSQVRLEFAGLIRRSWTPAELDILGKAARSALL